MQSVKGIRNSLEILNGGLMGVPMKQLKIAFGYKRLGRHVIKRIGEELDRNGIGYSPLSTRQDKLVMLYFKDRPDIQGVILATAAQIAEQDAKHGNPAK